jgi:hypothetical protein
MNTTRDFNSRFDKNNIPSDEINLINNERGFFNDLI